MGIFDPLCRGGVPQDDDRQCVLLSICLSVLPSESYGITNLGHCATTSIFVPPTIEMMTVRTSFNLCILPSVHPSVRLSHFCCITNLLDRTLGHRRYFLFQISQVLKKRKTNKLTLKPIKSIYYMLMCDITIQSSLLRPSLIIVSGSFSCHLWKRQAC
jgi:hypothetical protein